MEILFLLGLPLAGAALLALFGARAWAAELNVLVSLATFGAGCALTVRVIALAEDIVLTDAHWEVVNFLRDQYREHGHTPNFRNMLKGFQAIRPEADSQYLYELFPMGPAKQAVKLAGLPQPYGKGGSASRRAHGRRAGRDHRTAGAVESGAGPSGG